MSEILEEIVQVSLLLEDPGHPHRERLPVGPPLGAHLIH